MTSPSADEGDALLEAMKPIAEGFAQTIGPDAEVVLHDFRNPDESIIAIFGDLTGRKVGNSVTQVGLALIGLGRDADSIYNYTIRTKDGTKLRASTLIIRTSTGDVVGAICINIVVREQDADAVSRSDNGEWKELDFSGDIREVIRTVVSSESAVLQDLDDKSGRLRVVDALRRRGLFSIRKAVPIVAEELKVSRVTIYSYLDELSKSDIDGFVDR